jgi:iron(III) transport system ATP-binding protein/sulfate transport system ATP-binding protein/putative spermidine/putrescine transport system ATP-binding protein
MTQGDILSLVGPSGTGKSSLLKAIAGLDLDYTGDVLIQKENFNLTHANRRPVVLMFQEALLFPHMTVLENVIYGLHFTRMTKKERQMRGREFIHHIGMDKLERKYPHELSGGQQQRVALARALITQPKLLLLDEPFSSIDHELRREVTVWVRELLKQHQITSIFVTHDREEAMSLGDKLAVLGEGSLQQLGVPTDIYSFPKNRFVASFISEGILLDQRRFIHANHLRCMPSTESTNEYMWAGVVTSKRFKYGSVFCDIDIPALNQTVTLRDHEHQVDQRVNITLDHPNNILNFEEK